MEYITGILHGIAFSIIAYFFYDYYFNKDNNNY